MDVTSYGGMSFILGFSFTLPLAMFTFILYIISKRLPKEFIMTSIVVMLAGDATLVSLWYFGLQEIVDNLKLFKLGISTSFMFASFGRSLYFLLNSKHI